MLSNDSNEQQQQGDFSLLVNAHRGVAALMAKCRKCGAITRYGLALAWRLHTVTFPECATTMRLTEAEIVVLREGLRSASESIGACEQRGTRDDGLTRVAAHIAFAMQTRGHRTQSH